MLKILFIFIGTSEDESTTNQSKNVRKSSSRRQRNSQENSQGMRFGYQFVFKENNGL